MIFNICMIEEELKIISGRLLYLIFDYTLNIEQTAMIRGKIKQKWYFIFKKHKFGIRKKVLLYEAFTK